MRLLEFLKFCNFKNADINTCIFQNITIKMHVKYEILSDILKILIIKA